MTITFARKIPATAAVANESAQIREKTLFTLTPIKRATLWSSAVPLIARPIREYLKKIKNAVIRTKVDTIIQIWVWESTIPPSFNVSEGKGFGKTRLLCPKSIPAILRKKMLRPIVTITTAKTGSPSMGLRTSLSVRTPRRAAAMQVITSAGKNGIWKVVTRK
jgi:hypothetical protein